MPSATFRLPSSSPAMVSSLTALALAPGVLKTIIPLSAQASTGMLFTPTPALAMAFTEAGSAISCMAAERTRIPSGFSCFSPWT